MLGCDIAATMEINLNTGLMSRAQVCLSPHCDARPVGEVIDLLVIHGISLPPGEFGGNHIQDFFSNQLNIAMHPYFQSIAALKVSSHLLISRTGALWQFVPFNQRAWHAGHSEFMGRGDCNNFSIGIELEGTDEIAYTAAQYHCLTKVTHAMMRCYPQISWPRIVGHSDIAPGRKTDPGPSFDWVHYKKLVDKLI